jgi:hypothetical protein
MKKTVVTIAVALTGAGAMAAAVGLAVPAAAAPLAAVPTAAAFTVTTPTVTAPTLAAPDAAASNIRAAGVVAPAVAAPDVATVGAAPAHRSVTSPPLPPVTYSYGQTGPTVTVYKRTKTLATVTPTAITFDGTTGELELKVTANANYSFTAGEFLWEDPDGGDHSPNRPSRTLKFTKNSTRTITLTYDGVGKGDVIWSPDNVNVAAAWVFSASGAPVTAGPASSEPALGYAQTKRTVTVYQAGRVLATVTPKSVTYNRTKGTLKLSVSAKAKFSLSNGQFIWEDPDGGDHTASNPGKTFHLKKNSTRTITISFQKVGQGDIIWAPNENLVTGIWLVPAN